MTLTKMVAAEMEIKGQIWDILRKCGLNLNFPAVCPGVTGQLRYWSAKALGAVGDPLPTIRQ